MSQPESRAVVIVGGGVSGLSAAHELVRRKPDLGVTVVEAAQRPGGLLGTLRQDGYLLETAANAFLDGTPGTAVDLCRALGVELVTASPSAKRRWVFRHGALRQLPASPPAFLTTDLVSAAGRLRILLEPFAHKRPEREETVAEFGRRRLGPEISAAILDPFLVGVFAGDAEKLSMTAAMPRLAALEAAHGSLFRALLAGRAAGPGKLQAPVAGVGALADALAARLGDRVRLGARAVATRRHEGQTVIRLDDGSELVAGKVVLAVPPPAAAALVADRDADLAARLRACPIVSVGVVHVGLDAADVTHPLDGFGFLVARDEELRCLGCVFESSVWPERAPAGRVLLRLIYGGTREPGFVDLADDEVAKVVTSDLERTLGLRRAAPPLRIVRWKQAIPQYNLGHADWVQEVEGRAAALGLLLGGNAYHGVSVNECVKDAQRLADAVLGASSSAP